MFSYQDNKGKIPRVLKIKETNIRPPLFTSGDIQYFCSPFCNDYLWLQSLNLMRLFIIFVLSTQYLTPLCTSKEPLTYARHFLNSALRTNIAMWPQNQQSNEGAIHNLLESCCRELFVRTKPIAKDRISNKQCKVMKVQQVINWTFVSAAPPPYMQPRLICFIIVRS